MPADKLTDGAFSDYSRSGIAVFAGAFQFICQQVVYKLILRIKTCAVLGKNLISCDIKSGIYNAGYGKIGAVYA